MLQLLWLDRLFAFVALRKEAFFLFNLILDEYRSGWNSRPTEWTRTEFRHCIGHDVMSDLERVTGLQVPQ